MFCTRCGAQVSGAFCPNCGAAMSAGSPAGGAPPQQPPVSAPPPPPFAGPAAPAGMTYALWSSRVIGYIIDSLFVLVAMAAIYLVATLVFGLTAGIGGMVGSGGLTGLGGTGCCCLLALFPVSTILVGLYNKVYLVSQRGYSVGQGVMKLKVVDAQGSLLTRGTALIRVLAQAGLSFIPLLGLVDLLWPLWDDKRQTLHDKAVSSFVVNNPAR